MEHTTCSLIGNVLCQYEIRRSPVSPTVFIFGCVALFAAFVFATLCAYKLGTYLGWQDALRQYAQYEKADMTFDEGETLAAVVEIKKGKYFFLGTNTK
jgi:hypothetical protein